MEITQYRHLVVDRALPPPTDDEIADLEFALGAIVPASFREFLEHANGASLNYVFEVTFPDGETALEDAGTVLRLGQHRGPYETFPGELKTAREIMKIPPAVLPFARAGGNMLFLDLRDEEQGRVIGFIHGLPTWTGRRSDSNYVEVAKSFNEFVEKLQLNRDSVLDQIEHDVASLEHVEAWETWLDRALPAWRDDPAIGRAMRIARARFAD